MSTPSAAASAATLACACVLLISGPATAQAPAAPRPDATPDARKASDAIPDARKVSDAPAPAPGASAPPAPPARSEPRQAPAAAATPQRIEVQGIPLRSADPAAPISVLQGEALRRDAAATLGDTLAGQTGVGASSFGPNASRPTLRGLDGERVRLLSNAQPALDLSALSADHAVALEPLIVERIEILRGPAALLHGGSAIGGAVNLVDGRIPTTRREEPGLGGRAEVRLGGAARERSAAAVLAGGAGDWAWHADAFGRRSDDLRTPAHVPPDDAAPGVAVERLRNSAARTTGGAVGAAWIGAHGHLGASLDHYASDYGVVVEPDVTIRMRRSRLALAGEWRAEAAGVRSLGLQAGATDYQHQELEGGSVGTDFRTRGQNLALELIPQVWTLAGGPVDGALGAAWERNRASALGDEAFVPSTKTTTAALLGLQRWRFHPQAALSLGLRAEQVTVASDGDGPAALNPPRFGAPQSRRFSPKQAALSLEWTLPRTVWAGASLHLSAAHSERAPSFAELYADGAHVATQAWERGNPQQGLERGRNLELALAWKQGPDAVRVGVWHTAFSRYLALRATGEPDIEIDPGHFLPVYAFEGVRARLSGVELEGRWAVGAHWAPADHWAQGLALELRAEATRGDDLTNGEPLPRLLPYRATLAAAWAHGPWQLRLEAQRLGATRRVPASDTATPGATLWHLQAEWHGRLGPLATTVFLRGRNLGNALAYNAASVPTVRGWTPQGARAVQVGARWDW